MTSRPILFSGEMVRAILDGKKTVTRRLVTVRHRQAQPRLLYWTDEYGALKAHYEDGTRREASLVLRPYGVPGDTLWVRETWRATVAHSCAQDTCDCEDLIVEYRSTLHASKRVAGARVPDGFTLHANAQHWRPSIFMPQWASRITLRVTGHRVERLHCIDEDDARREGVESRADFAALWDKINGKRAPWADNPRVHRVEFEVVR